MPSTTLPKTAPRTGDLANVAALYTILPADTDYAAANYAALYEQDPRTVGVLGDSFSEYYMGYLSRRFAASWRDTYENALTPALTEAPGCRYPDPAGGRAQAGHAACPAGAVLTGPPCGKPVQTLRKRGFPWPRDRGIIAV